MRRRAFVCAVSLWWKKWSKSVKFVPLVVLSEAMCEVIFLKGFSLSSVFTVDCSGVHDFPQLRENCRSLLRLCVWIACVGRKNRSKNKLSMTTEEKCDMNT